MDVATPLRKIKLASDAIIIFFPKIDPKNQTQKTLVA